MQEDTEKEKVIDNYISVFQIPNEANPKEHSSFKVIVFYCVNDEHLDQMIEET